jgi:hypothetical protein
MIELSILHFDNPDKEDILRILSSGDLMCTEKKLII